MSEAILKTVLSLCLPCLVLLAACGPDPGAASSPEATQAEPTKADLTEISSPTGEEVFFPQVRPTGGGFSAPEARGGGLLILDEEGCLRMTIPGERPEEGEVPVWPLGFELDTTSGKEVRILDRRGRVVAEVGKKVVMGGGEIGKATLKENGILDERTWRELFERCPPGYGYWLVGEGVYIPWRGR